VAVVATVTAAPALPLRQTPVAAAVERVQATLLPQLAAQVALDLSVSGGLNKETTCNTHSSKTMRLKT
jgi:hypothetical protein